MEAMTATDNQPKEIIMSNVNFRKTAKGYSADYQRNDGFGFERRHYRNEDANRVAQGFGWKDADVEVPGEGWTVAEMLIVGGQLTPYRVTSTI